MERNGGVESEAGFSLIEVMVVVIVVSILAGIVMFTVGSIRDRGTDSALAADAETIRRAEEAFAARAPAGQAPTYATELQLATDPANKFLGEESDLHDVCLNGDKTRYVIVLQDAGCDGVVFP